MAITHAKTSAKSDGADSSLILPSDWNADHTGVLEGSSGGGLVLLEQHTASGSSTLDFTACISSTYDEYVVEFVQILPATNAADLQARVSTDGGSSWDSGGGNYVGSTMTDNGGVSGYSAGQMTIAREVAGPPSYGVFGLYGHMRIFNSSRPWFVGEFGYLTGSSVARRITHLSGDYEPAAFNAIRFFFSSGNISSGTIRVYGLAKA